MLDKGTASVEVVALTPGKPEPSVQFVEHDAPPAHPMLQVGAFTDHSRAQALADTLRQHLKQRVDIHDSGNQPHYYKVRIHIDQPLQDDQTQGLITMITQLTQHQPFWVK